MKVCRDGRIWGQNNKEARDHLGILYKKSRYIKKGYNKYLSEETKKKIGLAHKGKKHTEETKEKIRLWNLGRKLPEEARKKISLSRLGKKFSKETRLKMSKAHKGEKSNLWKGGVTPIRNKIESSLKYKQWRQDIFIRDGFICQKCGDNKGGNLEAHHKKSLSKLLEEIKQYLPLLDLYEGAMIYLPMWNIENGITLCEKCHKKIHKKR